MSLVAVRTPDQTQAMMDVEREARNQNQEASNPQQEQVIDNLAAKVRADWQVAKSVKAPITRRLIDCLERRRGMYSAEKMAQIKASNGSAIYMQLTGAKCRAAKAYLSDLYNPSGDKPFVIEPTPVPELPPEIQRTLMFEAMSVIQQGGVRPEDAKALVEKHRDRLMEEMRLEGEERAEKMGDKIEDMLIDANWRQEFSAFLDDLVTYPAAIMKGPVFRGRNRIKWVEIPGKGQFTPQRAREIVPEVRRVSPFDEYPSPGIRDSFEGHWNIEHRHFTFEELSQARNAPGYNKEAIEKALQQYRSGGLSEWLWTEDEHRRLTGQNSVYGKREGIDGLEWTGTVSGQMLVDWGMDERAVPDLYEEYPVSIVVIGTYTIRALINPDPAGKPDYFKATWESVPGSFWGNALPEIMADCQDMCNGAARALANNLGIASGPQVWVDKSRVADGADVKTIYPWKIWYMKNVAGAPNQRDPIGFFQPKSNANELMAVYERFSKYADEVTGMPAFAYGSDAGAGAAKTASGLSMLLNASSKTIKDVVHDIDIFVIEPLVEKFYNHIMMFHPDNSIKGDAKAKARGSEALIHKEAAQMRAQELLAITNNPVDLQIMGLDGRRELLEQTVSSGDMPVDRIVPGRDEFAEQQQLAAQQAQEQAALEQTQGEGDRSGDGD